MEVVLLLNHFATDMISFEDENEIEYIKTSQELEPKDLLINVMKLIENSVKVIKKSELAPPQCLCEFV